MDLRSLGAVHQSTTTPSQPGARPAEAGISPPGAGGPGASGSAPGGGVAAYLELAKTLASNELHAKSANLLTTGLRGAAATLRAAYDLAVSRLPARLVSKDWGFSVADGKLIFVQHGDELSTQDLTDLHAMFSLTNTESAAKHLADIIVSIVQLRNAGADSGSLAWVGFNVDEVNFGQTVDLRSYVTGSAPGSLYHPDVAHPVAQPPVPALLGGMDLRDLVTTRPKFLREDGTVNPEALTEIEAPRDIPQIATLHGQCLCGQIRFVAQDEFEYAFYCHCSRCRARTGSAFAAIAGIRVDKIEVIAGHEHLLLEGECSDGYGARCNRCYCFLFAAVRGRQYLHVSLGALRDTPGRVPDHHIYVGSKAPWYEITDALPQYKESP